MKQKGKRIGALVLAFVLTLALYPAPAKAQEKSHALGNSLTNQMLGSRTCEYGGRIYYGYDERIYSVKKDGTGKKTVYTMANEKGANGFSQIAVYNDCIYALFDFYGGSDACDLQLICVKLDGSGYRNYGNVASFSIADDRLYYTKAKMRKSDEGFSYMEITGIYVMEPDGGDEKKLIDRRDCRLLATDGNYLYYQYSNPKSSLTELYRCNMDGTNPENLWSGIGCVAVSGNYLYYSEEDYRALETGGSEWSSAIYRKNLKTNKEKKVYSCKGSITNFLINGKNLYVSTYEKGLVRINRTSGKSKTLNKHTGAGIRGIHGSVIVFEQFRMDEKNGTDIDMILAKLSTGKKIKKIGAYFVS